MLAKILAVVCIALVTGCATRLSNGSSTAGSLDLEFPRPDSKSYFLFDDSTRTISRATPRNGKLIFQLPDDQYIGQCVLVTDQSGKSMLEDKRYIYLAVRSEYQETIKDRQSVASELKTASTAEQSIRSQLEQSSSRLQSNRSYVNGSCYRPQPLPIPPRPLVRCGSHEECLQDGAAICFSRYLGAKGCGIALNEFKVPGLLSSPGCAAAAARLAGEKYELSDAFVDALHGIAEDAARDLMNSGNAGDFILGAIIGGASQYIQFQEAQACTSTFVERQFSPLRLWYARVEQIRIEPDQLLASCEQDLRRASALSQQLASASSFKRDLDKHLGAVDERLGKLERERRPIQWCKS